MTSGFQIEISNFSPVTVMKSGNDYCNVARSCDCLVSSGGTTLCQTRELHCMAYKPYRNFYKCLQYWQCIIFCKVVAIAIAFAGVLNQLNGQQDYCSVWYYKATGTARPLSDW